MGYDVKVINLLINGIKEKFENWKMSKLFMDESTSLLKYWWK